VRSAAQIERTTGEWRDHAKEERERTLRALLAELDRAFRERAEWYMWVLNGQPVLSDEAYARTNPKRAAASRRARGRRLA
jgi:hypothetical protein